MAGLDGSPDESYSADAHPGVAGCSLIAYTNRTGTDATASRASLEEEQ